ncbi:Rrf2 family transcriptional regulator [Daejeonia sp. YH14]|uniref:Rrf2 family transcriptional regulator n=1 Tax=Daejeonia sp. YH14 TaxID=3439042 RepID=UPI003F497192
MKFAYLCGGMNNTRFATAIHLMTLLAKHPDEWLSSEWLAGSISIHPVVVRREVGILKTSGLIECRKGKEGGCRIGKRPADISLADIFDAVNDAEVLGKKNQNPNPRCEVGRKINGELAKLYQETNDLVRNFLKSKRLEDFSKEF